MENKNSEENRMGICQERGQGQKQRAVTAKEEEEKEC